MLGPDLSLDRWKVADFFSILIDERSVKKKGLLPMGRAPSLLRWRKKQNLSLLLLDDDLNAAVHGTSRWRVVAGDWVAVSVTCGG